MIAVSEDHFKIKLGREIIYITDIHQALRKKLSSLSSNNRE